MSSSKIRPKSHSTRPSSRGSTHSEEAASRDPPAYWDFTCNDIIHINYEQEISKISTSLRSYEEDYSSRCKAQGITSCPMIRCREKDLQRALYLYHAKIDLANWQVMIMSVISCTISSIFLYGLEISRKHVSDLLLGLSKTEQVKQLCLEYLTIKDDEFCECLATIFSCEVQFISLRGCRISDLIVEAASSRIMGNTVVEVINLSNNSITDEGASTLFDSLRLSPSMKFISLRNNRISGACLQSLLAVIIGSEVTHSVTSQMKAINTAITSRNKKIKELLKKAVKEGKTFDVEEIPSLDSRIFKVGNDAMIANRTIREVDLSRNPLSADIVSDAYNSALMSPAFNIIQESLNCVVRVTGLDVDGASSSLTSENTHMGLRFET